MNRLRDLDLKLPEMKVPLVLSDLFYDLRERRLLPLVALLAVALISVPFLLSDSGTDSENSATPAPEAGAARAREVSRLTVVQTDHGLREPDKRLGHRAPKDPFIQQYTGPANGGAEVTQASTSATSTPSTSTPSTSTSVTTEGGSEPAGGAPAAPPSSTSPIEPSPASPGTSEDEITIFTFAVDLKIVKTTTDEDGKKSKSEPETRERVLPSTTLPGKKTQVITYLGISPKTKKPLFLVSDEVTSIFGEAECVAGSGSCQLLELEQGFPLTLLYGPNDVRYKFTVLDIEPLATGHF
jgi:hypothetical protein